jgi:hypothetical protein
MTDEYKSLDNGLKQLSGLLTEVAVAFRQLLEIELQKVENIKETMELVKEQQERDKEAIKEWEKANQNG